MVVPLIILYYHLPIISNLNELGLHFSRRKTIEWMNNKLNINNCLILWIDQIHILTKLRSISQVISSLWSDRGLRVTNIWRLFLNDFFIIMSNFTRCSDDNATITTSVRKAIIKHLSYWFKIWVEHKTNRWDWWSHRDEF